MKQSFKAGVASLLAAALIGAGPALAEEKGGDKPAAEAKSDISLPPLPADKSVKQTMVLGGKTLSYTATVGSLPVRDGKGKVIADVVFTAYTLDGAAPGTRRPVTFAFNGGPGAASVYLNLGAIGPKRVQFGAAGDAPSDSPALIDNPASWLDFTDLVFIDPVGTGYSRSLVDLETTKKTFFGVDSDIAYLSRVVFDWLVKNGRMASPKYVTGESYGGFRAPRITYALQTEYGVGVSGVVMVSPFLDAKAEVGGDFSPMPWITSLPSMAAAELERQGKPIGAQAMAPIEAFARGDMVVDLLKGSSDEAAFNDLVTHVATYTGLDPRLVRTLAAGSTARPICASAAGPRARSEAGTTATSSPTTPSRGRPTGGAATRSSTRSSPRPPAPMSTSPRASSAGRPRGATTPSAARSARTGKRTGSARPSRSPPSARPSPPIRR